MNLIVFDIDDTLAKSEYQHQLAYVNAMKEFGITELKIDANNASAFIATKSWLRRLAEPVRT